MPRGLELVYWTIILFGLAFMCWWPLHNIRKMEREGLANPEECPRCGRMTETLDLHIRYCKGQAVRRNPLGGNRNVITRALKQGENVDKLKPKKEGELEDLY